MNKWCFSGFESILVLFEWILCTSSVFYYPNVWCLFHCQAGCLIRFQIQRYVTVSVYSHLMWWILSFRKQKNSWSCSFHAFRWVSNYSILFHVYLNYDSRDSLEMCYNRRLVVAWSQHIFWPFLYVSVRKCNEFMCYFLLLW